MKSSIIGMTLLFLTGSISFSQIQVIPIWQPQAPPQTIRLNLKQSNITTVEQPALAVFLPEKRYIKRPAVLIFPGGGYRQIVVEKEGYKIARWLNRNGITAFVLTYRLHRDTALLDAQRALSLIRSRAEEFNIDPGKIGVMGFSAGADLSLNLATHSQAAIRSDHIDSTGYKPNFMILVYGSYYSLINLIEKETPPAFLVHAADDDKAPVSQSIDLYLALRHANVPAEMHIYEKGGHGFALEEERGPVISWSQQCINWMKTNEFVSLK